MKNNYFVIPTSVETKPWDFVKFVYPLKSYCVGFLHEYELSDIPKDAYIYINRILDTKAIESLKSLLPEIAKRKGIFLEDLGVYELTKDLPISHILYATHASCSSSTINTYLEFMDSVVISPDITEAEEKMILDNSKKELILYAYGPLPYMYSRRTLLTNFANHKKESMEKTTIIKEKTTTKGFFMVENDYGTVIFDEKRYDARPLVEHPNVLGYLINLDWEEKIEVTSWLDDWKSGKKQIDATTGFLHQKTIYRNREKGGQP